MHKSAAGFAFSIAVGVMSQFVTAVFPTQLWWLQPVLFWISAVVALVSLIAFSYEFGRGEWSRLWNPYLSLSEAAKIAFEKSRQADYYDPGDAAGRLKYHAIDLILDAIEPDRRFHKIWGTRPPALYPYEPIPETFLKVRNLTSDLRSLHRDDLPNRIDWDNLSVRRSDLKAHIKRQSALVQLLSAAGTRRSDRQL